MQRIVLSRLAFVLNDSDAITRCWLIRIRISGLGFFIYWVICSTHECCLFMYSGMGGWCESGGVHRKDLKDLWARGDDARWVARAGSRARTPRSFGVWAQKAHI